MSINKSTELFINMKSIPAYNKKKHYFDQSKDVLDFYAEEEQKLLYGTNIGGFHIHPWLYWHINYFKTPLPMIENGIEVEKILNPPLDDNILYVTETYQQAAEENKGMLVFGGRGVAKALRNDEVLLYHDKTWRPIGEARIGDKIFGADGKLTNILGVYPQGEVDLYKVTLRDGREIVCCDEHLWEVYTKNGKWSTVTLKDIRARMTPTNKFSIPLNSPIEFKEEDYDIDPYFIGYIIGDGGLTRKGIDISFSPEDEEEQASYLETTLDKYRASLRKIQESRWYVENGSELRRDIWNLGLNKPSWEKRIPEDYMKGSIKQRMELLRGLMDSDGCCYQHKGGKGSTQTYCGTSKGLSEDIQELCNSLGIQTSVHSRIREREGRVCRKSYEIILKTDTNVFNLKRKKSRIIKRKTGNPDKVRITKIVKVDRGLATCIRVDNKDKLFVTSNYVVTHNSTTIASLTSWLSTMRSNGTVSIVGGNDGDLNAISALLQTGMDKVHPAFYLPRLKSDFKSLVEFGVKEKDNSKHIHSRLDIRNADDSKKGSSEKGAGMSPVGAVMDEVGKWNFIGLLDGLLPSFKTEHGAKLVHFLAGTGGNSELSKDAKKAMTNPSDYSLLMLNRDRLDRSVPEEALTWKKDKEATFCTFMPGQMSYRLSVPKVTKRLSDHLDIQDKNLAKIKVRTTDWVKATKAILKERSEAKKDSSKQKLKMYYPTTTDHCFLIDAVNPFPTAVITKHIEKLESKGKLGKSVSLYRSETGYKWEFSEKKRAEVSHGGGVIDAPIILYQDIPEIAPQKFVFVGGSDGYKIDVSETDSLGSTYIIKRRNLAPNEPCETIAASIATRPEKMRTFLQESERMMIAWNAMTNMESIDVGLQHHLETKGIQHEYLAPAFSFQSKVSKNAPALNSKFGLYPTTGNNIYRFNVLVDYAWDEHTIGLDEENNPIIKYGVEFIDCIDLLKEMLYYKPGNNVDRITSFSHALVYARELDKADIQPERPRKSRLTKEELLKRKRMTKNSRYGTKGHKKY